MSAKLLEFPDLKTQEMEGGGRDQTEIIHIVSLWAMTEGPIDCTSSQENLSIPVKASFKSSPPDKHIRRSDIPSTRES